MAVRKRNAVRAAGKKKAVRHRNSAVKKNAMLYVAVAILLVPLAYQLYSHASVYWIRYGYVENVTSEAMSDLLFEYEITRYSSSVEISEPEPGKNIGLGFVTDPWNLKFGVLPFNGSSEKRQVLLLNHNDERVRVSVVAFGGITPMLDVPTNDFILDGKESKVVDIHIKPRDSAPGEYFGEIDIVVKRAKNAFASSMV